MAREKHHDKGQEDYATGKDYHEPHDRGILEVFHIPSKEEQEDRDAYEEGWNHAKSQDKD